uniref:Transmembrane protein 14C n=1 Tax=Terrapene triunguis TaxID=2587831 RepID=A0A674JYL2_9SAUR
MKLIVFHNLFDLTYYSFFARSELACLFCAHTSEIVLTGHLIFHLVASGTLTGVMGMRFYNSGKVMPAGLIAGASLLMVGRLGLKLIEKPHDP